MVKLTSILLVLALALASNAHCCSNYQVGSSCCNIFGCNCDGPCWNAGCKTDCGSKYPNNPVACNGKDGYYDCCLRGSSCRSSSVCKGKEYQCCCESGADKQVLSVTDVKYDLANAKLDKDSAAAVVYYQYQGENQDSEPHNVGSLSFSKSVTQDSSETFSESLSFTESATITAGIPFFEGGQFEVGSTQTFDHSTTNSKVSNANCLFCFCPVLACGVTMH